MRTQVAIAAMAVSALLATSSSPRTAMADTALGTSAWSLEIGTDIGTGGDDVSIAIRRHSGASSAFRLGMELFGQKSDGEGKNVVTGSPDQDATLVQEFYSAALLVQWMHFAPIVNNVTATFAVGPVLEIVGQSFRFGQGAGTPGFNESESWQRTTAYGLDLALGVEWFFTRRVSLGGVAAIRGTIGSGSQVQIGRSGTGPTYTTGERNLDLDISRVDTGSRIQLVGYF